MKNYDSAMLAKSALEARNLAYIPYSNFAVGAALLAESGKVYLGGNIENSAYSVCNCAERTALFKAISEGERNFVAIAVCGAPKDHDVTTPLPFCSPCGVCRQALSEFVSSDFPVLLVYSEDKYDTFTLGELLSHSFGPDNLK